MSNHLFVIFYTCNDLFECIDCFIHNINGVANEWRILIPEMSQTSKQKHRSTKKTCGL